MRTILVAALVAMLVATAAGCGSSSSSYGSSSGSQSSAAQSGGAPPAGGTTHLAKTKFALHAGLAFGAFHRYIYKPFKQGKFSGGLLHHKLAVVKGALAAGFAIHEIRIALDDARSSKVLSKLLSPLLALQTKLSSLKAGLHGGKVDPAAITSANNDTSSVSADSARSGHPIMDEPTPALGG